MTPSELDRWLKDYGRAWEARDPDAFAALFSPDASYHWTPFMAPQVGRQAIAAAVSAAIDGQRDIRFTYRLLSGSPCVAHWTCRFTRIPSGQPVTLDGIFVMRFDDQQRCEEFRGWWHSDEPEAPA